ncbi:MAG: hypothetical protein ACREV9_14400 [Burkholderiales bacterium]
MTAVARLGIQRCPMLIGDLLVSGPEFPGSTAFIPTTDEFSAIFPPGCAWVPRGLRQKIAIVDDGLVVGWAGDLAIATDVIADLVQKSASVPFTKESLRHYFDGLSEAVWKEIELVGFIDDHTGMTPFCSESTIEFPTQLFGKVGLLGSGAKDLEKILRGLSQLPQGDRSLNPVEQSVGFGLQLTGILLNVEIATLKNLSNFYGGGYEIATLLNGKFAKLDDVTYLFWTAYVDSKEVRISRLPVRACRYAYHEDMLLIRSARFEDKGESRAIDERLFVISPVYREAQPRELSSITPPSLNARHLCNYFLIPMSAKELAIFAMVCLKERAEDEKWVKFTETPAEVTASIDGQFITEVARETARKKQPS